MRQDEILIKEVITEMSLMHALSCALLARSVCSGYIGALPVVTEGALKQVAEPGPGSIHLCVLSRGVMFRAWSLVREAVNSGVANCLIQWNRAGSFLPFRRRCRGIAEGKGFRALFRSFVT